MALGAVPAAFSQAASPSLNQATIPNEEKRLYAGAEPYMDSPAQDLEKRVGELKGLRTDTSQERLSDLLLKIGARVDELTQKVPNLISDERVTQIREVNGHDKSCLSHPAAGGEWPTFPVDNNCSQHVSARSEWAFHYIIESHQTRDGPVLDEFRTDEKNQPLESSARGPVFQGFVGSWIIFWPPNSSQSRFRYLGEQKIGKRETLVVAFAQIPGSVSVPVTLVSKKGTIPILFQGVAWVDRDDFRILQLRTDILAPQQEFGLEKQTSKILFGRVNIAQLSLELWLPMGVDVRFEDNGVVLQEQHAYSHYHMYRATSRIVP
jgi:hypothetical protein